MVTYTSNPIYWTVFKPRIRIYSFTDTTYANPQYTFDPFTDVGSDTKVIRCQFETHTTNVGSFFLEIEDSSFELDLDTLTKGNRVFIECSKDGSIWQSAFKGLVRSSKQKVLGIDGRTISINGYNYLIRLNERLINVIKESALVGGQYDRTDSTMFTNNLINDLLSTDSNYIYSSDDTQLYSIFKTNNISSSPITNWIPRLDADFSTLNDVINSVLTFSNGLLTLDPNTDQLILYNGDLVTSTTGIFLLTDSMNQAADDADFTMYPLEPYTSDVSYDYPDSGSRLIASIGSVSGTPCPEIPSPRILPSPCTNLPASGFTAFVNAGNNRRMATEFRAGSTNLSGLTVRFLNWGDSEHITPPFRAQVRTKSGDSVPSAGSQVGSNMNLYWDGNPSLLFPGFRCCSWQCGLESGDLGVTGLSVGTNYWLVLWSDFDMATPIGGNTYYIAWWGRDCLPSDKWSVTTTDVWSGTSGWTTAGISGSSFNGPLTAFDVEFSAPLQEECGGGGGSQVTIDTDPVFAVAHDRNASLRNGIVERLVYELPPHIKTAQTLHEYLFNRLSFVSKPRFLFEYPAVTAPNKMPKAGDLCSIVDNRLSTGTQSKPIQTGAISSISYNFEQDSVGILGLRKLSLAIGGVRRGYY